MTDVYLITNTVNGKHYVGISSRGFEMRWEEHKLMRDKCLLASAINKYGPDAFRVDLIEQCETWEQACAQERFWIQYIGTRPPFGYNMTDGGEGLVGVRWSEESRERLSLVTKARAQTPEGRERLRKIAKEGWASGKLKHVVCTDVTRKKMSDAARGRVGSNKGKKFSAEHCAKISASKKGRPCRPSPRKLDQVDVRRVKFGDLSNLSCAKAGTLINCSAGMVHNIRKGKAWKHVTEKT